jgi:hypothetical protein
MIAAEKSKEQGRKPWAYALPVSY